MRYQSMNETDTIIAKIDGDERFDFIVDADGPLQTEYHAWIDAGNTLEPYVVPAHPVPETISDRQFFQQAAAAGLITQAEALAAVQTGAIPSILMNVINGLPTQMQQFAAEMMLAGATQFNRHHPLTEAVGSALGWDAAQIDQFFIDASQL